MKKCQRCNKPFNPDKLHPYQKYCSYWCRYKVKYERSKGEPMIKICKICKIKFNPRGNQKTCSKKCSKINHSQHSRKWNLKHWESFYQEYMKKYHKKEWQRYKEKYNIKDRPFVQQFIITNKIKKLLGDPQVIEEASFNWLRGKNDSLMKVDAYFPKFNLIVEYDGEQHFQPVQWGGISKEEAIQNMKLQQERDRLKDKLIRERGLKLLRFRHDEPIRKEYIQERLNKII